LVFIPIGRIKNIGGWDQKCDQRIHNKDGLQGKRNKENEQASLESDK
jgi:hypothetical protein